MCLSSNFLFIACWLHQEYQNKFYFTKKVSKASWWSSWCLKFQLFRKQIWWCGWNSNYEGLYGANSQLIWPDITLSPANAIHYYFSSSHCPQLTCLGRKCGNIWLMSKREWENHWITIVCSWPRYAWNGTKNLYHAKYAAEDGAVRRSVLPGVRPGTAVWLAAGWEGWEGWERLPSQI